MGAFPDISVCGVDKIYDPDGNVYVRGQDRDGYVIFQHDRTADGGQEGLIDRRGMRYTKGTYTVDACGRVTQVEHGTHFVRLLLKIIKG